MKIIKISDCSECPYFEPDPDVCSWDEQSVLITVDAYNEIDPRCPLEDYRVDPALERVRELEENIKRRDEALESKFRLKQLGVL